MREREVSHALAGAVAYSFEAQVRATKHSNLGGVQRFFGENASYAGDIACPGAV